MAIINAVLAGLPGQMGVGVYVSMAFEAWMAYAIAKHIGVKLSKPSDVFKYFSLLSGVGFTIIVGIKHILSLLFSMFSVIPLVNPLIFAEIVMTDLVGVLFWVGFEEVKKNDSFTIPKRALNNIVYRVKEIVKYQFNVIKKTFTLENMKLVAKRLKSWLNGDIVKEQKIINGEMFADVAMAYLLSGHYEKLKGPLGETFLEAIKLRWSSQFDENSTIEDIAKKFSEYTPEQLQGALNTIKGKMFEIMVTNAENSDNDNWFAHMHKDETYPGSDIIFTNPETGEHLEVSLKAVNPHDTSIIEHALSKYPDYPIITTDEAAKILKDNPMVHDSGISNEYLQHITEKNMDELLNSIQPIDASTVMIKGVAVGTMAAIWPFVIAYSKKKISYESFEKALKQILGNSGVMLASRLAYAVILGPIFAWYLLARRVKLLVNKAEENYPVKKIIVKF